MPDQMRREVTLELVTALFTDGQDFDFLTGGKQCLCVAFGLFHDVGVETTAKAPL